MSAGTAHLGAVRIAYETFGRPQDPAVVLVMGLGAQMIGWDEDFCAALADRGLYVVRFDNRDVGDSTRFTDVPAPDLEAALRGERDGLAYTVEDMADDIAGLADALGLARFSLVGISLGGMIAQVAAVRHQERVDSLCSIMAGPAPDVDRPRPEALAALFGPPASTREENAERAVRNARVIGSPGFPLEVERVRAKALRAYDRGIDPLSSGRQLAAILAAGDRTDALRGLRVPTLVIHGEDDPLVPVACGHETAAAIPGAQLEVVPGLGHDLPTPLWPLVIQRIADLVTLRGGGAGAAR